MPIYEYACGSCGHHFEAKQKFTDDPITKCPECGQTVRRVLHPAGIIFKGSGFYINDSRGNGSKSDSNGSSSTSTTPAAPTTTTETKSESGPSSESKSKPETVSPTTDSK